MKVGDLVKYVGSPGTVRSVCEKRRYGVVLRLYKVSAGTEEFVEFMDVLASAAVTGGLVKPAAAYTWEVMK